MSNPEAVCENRAFSPLYDILRVTMMFGMLGMVIRLVNGTHFYSKQCWKKDVWRNAWYIDNEEWVYTSALFSDAHYLNLTMSDTRQHLIWLEITNRYPEYIQMASNLAELVCRCSNLKSDSVMYKGTQLSVWACGNCDSCQEENLEHVVMLCPNNDDIWTKIMLDLILI